MHSGGSQNDPLPQPQFILSAAIVLINSVFVACGVVTPLIYQNIIGWTITAYIAGNVWQKKGEV